MGSDISYLVSYQCPSCRTALQGRADRPDPWLRCPKCGRASRPPGPEAVVKRALAKPFEPPEPGENVHVIGPPPELKPMTPVAVATPISRPTAVGRIESEASHPAPTLRPLSDGLARRSEESSMLDLRVVFASGVFVSTTLFVFAYLESSTLGTTIFGLLAGLFLLPLIWPSRVSR